MTDLQVQPQSGEAQLPLEGDLVARTVRHIGEYLERDVTHLTQDSRFDTALPGLDSLKLFEMMLYLEDCFGIRFEESAITGIQTLRELVKVIDSHLAADAAGGHR